MKPSHSGDQPKPHELDKFGITAAQQQWLLQSFGTALAFITKEDSRERSFAVAVITKEGDNEDGSQTVSVDMVTPMDKQLLKQLLTDWIMKDSN